MEKLSFAYALRTTVSSWVICGSAASAMLASKTGTTVSSLRKRIGFLSWVIVGAEGKEVAGYE